MALLHSLEICGVRSFSPEYKEIITFNTPVTLFLGQNGCGKTTIIECIRFALTSELPSGSSSGQGFLNDPKMSHKSQVKASIKIKFLDSQGNMITVSRFMSVTTKSGGGLTFKNLLPNIRKRDRNNQDNPEDISGRCVDIDSYCCSVLNVSKSILNNVLFCHQENSAWPLDEPKKLKEKFDEIFDAVKYNKCVDIMRKNIKEKQANIRLLKERLEHRRTIKQEVERIMGKLSTKNEELASMLNLINEKEILVRPLELRIKEILTLEETLGSLQRELYGKQTKRQGLIEQQSTIKKHISHIFEGTDEELKNDISNFNFQQTKEKNAIFELEKKKNEFMEKISEININIQTTQVHIGQFKEEQRQHTKTSQEFKDLVESLRLKLELNEFPDIYNGKAIIDTLTNSLKLANASYNSLVKQKDMLEKEIQSQIDVIREECAAGKEQLSSKTKLVAEARNRIKIIRDKLEDLDSSDSQLKLVDRTIEDNKLTLKKLKESFNEVKKTQEIEELKEMISSKEQDLEKFDREYRVLQQNYAKEQQLESETNTMLDKQREITRLKNKHSEKLHKIFGENVPEKNIKNSILDIQNTEDMKVKSIMQRINKLEKEITALETTIKHNKKKLSSDKNELASKQKKIDDICDGKLFAQVLQECTRNKEKCQKDKGQYTSGKIMYEAFISKFEKESPCCPICETDFKNRGSIVKEIIKKLKARIESIPAKLTKVEAELRKEEIFFNKLQQLKPVHDDINMLLNTKIPELEAEICLLDDEYEEKQLMLASEKANLISPQELIEVSKVVIADAALLDQHHSDISKAKITIANLEQSIIKISSNRSRQETEAQIDVIKAELSNLKNRLESSKKMLDQHKDRCHQLNVNIQNEVQKQIDIQKLIQEKPLLEIQHEEFSEKLVILNEEIHDLTDVLQIREKDLKKSITEKQDIIQNNRMIKEKEQHRLNVMTNMLKDIQKLQHDVERYLNNNIDRKLDTALEELAKLNIDLKKVEETKTKIVDAITEKKECLAKKETEFRALEDNVTLRELQKAEESLKTEIAELEQNIGGFNYRSVRDEKQRIERNIDKHTKEINSLKGQQEEIRKQVRDLETDLDKPQNKNAYNNFKKQYYELRLDEFLIEDLGEYVRVLEKSVLKFHEERMVQINRTIRELWRSIYRGNDIDYIEIKTDEHMVGGVNRRRTYNYKVVQVKNNVELEMRGRCSAGQKVLACLVIRMALAETFSSHCGILALDEPTTNLDRENIQSLSDALSRIIADRENQTHFQLLIITHDEDFLDSLTRMQTLDNYWKVKRNQSGFSKVEKQYL